MKADPLRNNVRIEVKHGHGDGIDDGHDPVIHGIGDGITNEGADIGSKVGAGSGGIDNDGDLTGI